MLSNKKGGVHGTQGSQLERYDSFHYHIINELFYGTMLIQ